MKSIFNFIVILSVALISLQSAAFSEDSPATTGFEFLRMDVGARAAALSGAIAGLSSDPLCTFQNPAGLANVRLRGGSVTYLKHLLDFHSGTVAGVLPQKWGTLGIGINYINYGEFDETTEQQPDGTGNTFGANAFELAVSGARMYEKILSYGATVKYIRSSISEYTSDAFAVNIGLIFHAPFQQDLNIGVAIFNYGWTNQAYVETKDDLPLNFRVGFSKKLAYLPLMLVGQVYKYTDDIFQFNAGGEISVTPELFLRVGYNSLGQDQKLDLNGDKFAGLNFGMGFHWRTYRIDYALSSMGEIGSLNRFTLSAVF